MPFTPAARVRRGALIAQPTPHATNRTRHRNHARRVGRDRLRRLRHDLPFLQAQAGAVQIAAERGKEAAKESRRTDKKSGAAPHRKRSSPPATCRRGRSWIRGEPRSRSSVPPTATSSSAPRAAIASSTPATTSRRANLESALFEERNRLRGSCWHDRYLGDGQLWAASVASEVLQQWQLAIESDRVKEAAFATTLYQLDNGPRCPTRDDLVSGKYVARGALIDSVGTSITFHCTPATAPSSAPRGLTASFTPRTTSRTVSLDPVVAEEARAVLCGPVRRHPHLGSGGLRSGPAGPRKLSPTDSPPEGSALSRRRDGECGAGLSHHGTAVSDARRTGEPRSCRGESARRSVGDEHDHPLHAWGSVVVRSAGPDHLFNTWDDITNGDS